MTKEIDVNSEPLPGYRLIERIGAGGYGEVWRVEAPGGLTKAIKFVFGQQHEKRAMNESRAMDHIRGVRHPFLLSLERIEVVDGRLLVVTELADCSVKDRFDLCRRDGLRGIPREELLSYLRDAADALDFMGGTHALQHLDIKPENLLLLAGHVKVADFGLVKDVRQSQASLVGGMTPLYAAPEVFRGTPSRQSDQYSLAIVYQEMLTGTLPFVGSSAAELTLHHLNDEPDLASLAAVDRYSVSRALSKDPQHRYASCRELIDSLIKVADAGAPAVQSPGASYTSSPTSEYTDAKQRDTQQTDFFDDEQPAGWSGQSSQMLLDMPSSDCQLVDLPPVDVAGRDGRPAPTLVLGIGGTAGRVLMQFRRMLNDQWGSGKDIPAVQLLLVDTDARSLSEATRDASNGLAADEVLSLPLRRPQHYRENSQQLLHWLSRRWLYNIPRSLQTEGLRPLGRLALADQARQAGQSIRRSMVQALDPVSLAKSSAAIGQQFRSDAMRVIVVSSISGGTGSGMSLDLGYAVRAVVQKLGLAHAQVIGLMMHSTGRDARHSELARVNAFSWLTEFKHFQGLENAYPGDVSCGLPAHAAGVAAFDHTYLIQLGENLDGVEFEQATQGVAEYIRFNTLSPASAFFDACRASSTDVLAQDRPSPANLRSFGVYRQSAAPAGVNDEFTGLVSQQVLSIWRGATAGPLTRAVEADGNQLVQRLHLDVAGIAGNARSLIEMELGMEPGAFLTSWFKDRAVSVASGAVAALASIDQVFGRGKSVDESDHAPTLLGRAPVAIVGPLADKLGAEVRRWVSRRIDEPSQRLSGARRALDWTVEHFGRVEAELQRIRGALDDRLVQIPTAAAAAETPAKNAVGAGATNPSCIDEYFHMSLDQLTILAAEHVVHAIQAEAKAMSDEVISLGREVDQIAAAVGRTAMAAATAASSARGESTAVAHGRLATSFQARLPEIAARVDAQLQAEYIESNGGLMKTIMQGGRPRAQLSAKLHELSSKAVCQALAGANGGDSEMPGSDLHTALAMATPAFLEYGGQRRVLAILPSESANSTAEGMVTQLLGTSATTVRGTDGQVTVCVEADQLSLQHIALDFVERRRDRVEFAERVHCRTDITWTPLVSAEVPALSMVWGTESANHTQSQNAMCKTMVL